MLLWFLLLGNACEMMNNHPFHHCDWSTHNLVSYSITSCFDTANKNISFHFTAQSHDHSDQCQFWRQIWMSSVHQSAWWSSHLQLSRYLKMDWRSMSLQSSIPWNWNLGWGAHGHPDLTMPQLSMTMFPHCHKFNMLTCLFFLVMDHWAIVTGQSLENVAITVFWPFHWSLQISCSPCFFSQRVCGSTSKSETQSSCVIFS